MADSVQAERDRNLARHHPADTDRDGVRRHVPAARGEEIFVLFLADVDAAATAANQYTGALFPITEPRIAPCFACRDDAEQRRARVTLRIGAAVRAVVS